MLSCKQGESSGSNITEKMFWWSYFAIIAKIITKVNVPRNYFVMISARMVLCFRIVVVGMRVGALTVIRVSAISDLFTAELGALFLGTLTISSFWGLSRKVWELPGKLWIAVEFHSERTSGEVAEKLPGKFGELSLPKLGGALLPCSDSPNVPPT